MSRLPVLAAATVAVSLLAAGVAFLTLFDPHTVLRALSRANILLLISGVLAGGASQVLRAQRTAAIVRSRHPVSLEQTFGARVLSHAVGSILPLGPAGMGLEGILLRRLARVPIAFSTGVIAACGVLDHVSAFPLLVGVLLTMHLPAWLRLLLLGTLLHTLFSLLIPLVAAATRSHLRGLAPRSGWRRKVIETAAQVEDGLSSIVAGGWRIVVPALALSFLLAAVALLRLALFLGAFEFHPSPHQLVLLLLMAGLIGSVPIQVPGANVWATGKLMRLVHLLGPGAGAFVLMSSVIALIESPLLACGMLLWWTLPHSGASLRLSELIAMSQEQRRDQTSSAEIT